MTVRRPKGVPAPVQAGKRWVVECSHSWMNGYGKLRLRTEKDSGAVDLYLAASYGQRQAPLSTPDPTPTHRFTSATRTHLCTRARTPTTSPVAGS